MTAAAADRRLQERLAKRRQLLRTDAVCEVEVDAVEAMAARAILVPLLPLLVAMRRRRRAFVSSDGLGLKFTTERHIKAVLTPENRPA